MKSVFVTGTAGSGKSLLTSKLAEYYTRSGSFAAVLNMDPGVVELPYTCDIDVRDHVDIISIMRQHELGPNGALVVASDLIATKIDEIRGQVDAINPDYLLVDTPGQIELFAYRQSGPFIVQNLTGEEKAGVFLFDGAMLGSPANFVSISLLAASVRLRLGLPAASVLTKIDLIGEKLNDILKWSAEPASLDEALAKEADGDAYQLASNIMRGLDSADFIGGLIPVSSATGAGMDVLRGELSRITNLGEEVED